MIRQARTYLVGAMSGATLIAIAIAAFVLLVTAEVGQRKAAERVKPDEDDEADHACGEERCARSGAGEVGVGLPDHP